MRSGAAIASDTKHISLELDNNRVRIFRARVGPHESVLTDLRVKVSIQ